MNMTRGDFLGVPIDLLTMDQTIEVIRQKIQARSRMQHVALNVAKFVNLQTNKELRDDVLGSDFVGVDGMGILWAARFLGVNVPERVAGVDLMIEILGLCAREGYRPYFLGARAEVLQRALQNAEQQFPAIQVAGAQHGYYAKHEEAAIVQTIRESKADCLFVGMPTPTKEYFLAAYRDSLDIPFIMGVGGSIDVLAGYVRRAPLWMQKSGLEWLYRTMQEPRRMWKRYLTTNTVFVGIVAKELFDRWVSPQKRRDY
jgi:N-acetylglucosaminyldiphosphoundecaprenol N-acetyl-beta-D-mannosaminyltransferase